jgi:WbqC-like protein family
MNCVILQPSYIPWRGYFHQIQKADLFIFYDDVNFDKNGWRNRNRVKTANGTKWLTIPVTAGQDRQLHTTPINQVQICQDQPWKATHWRTLRHSYSKAPFFKRYAPLLEPIYQTDSGLLSDFVINLTRLLTQTLGIDHTRFVKSSDVATFGAKTERLIGLLTAVGATHYITGPAARSYMDESLFHAVGITTEYMQYDYSDYDQLYPPFDPAVSILDLLFMKGPDASRYIWR